MAYDNLHPYGHEIDHYVGASTTAALYNIYSKKGSRPKKAEDFIPKRKKAQKPTDQVEAFKMIARMHNKAYREEERRKKAKKAMHAKAKQEREKLKAENAGASNVSKEQSTKPVKK